MDSVLASAIAMTVIVAVRYLITSGMFAWATHKVRPGHYAGLDKQIRSEITWSLATAATGLATGPVSLGLARIGVGIGEAAFVAPAYSLLTDYFKPERRGLAFAILGLATYFGQIAGQAGGPALAAEIGWRVNTTCAAACAAAARYSCVASTVPALPSTAS